MRLAPDVAAYLARVEQDWPGLLDTPRGRRILTRLDPRLFALVYLRHHLTGDETDDVVSFSSMHLDWYDQMLEWVKPNTKPKEWRRAYVSPRASAKSTTWFLIAPLWAAAHKHVTFVAAFADSASQAEGHLTSFKRELDTNALLRKDYPELCRPLMRERGTAVADNRNLMQQRSGFIFAAKGVDSAALGMKVGEHRPDLIILDDVEPSESNYSADLVVKRLSTIQNALLPLNEWARTVWVGTVTMDGSLIHELVKTAQTAEVPAQWIADERFRTHYYPALIVDDDGTERSVWPEKWPLTYLESIRHTRSFLLNYQNAPIPVDGIYWGPDDITYDTDWSLATRHIISIDPAVTHKKSSDNSGIAVLSHDRQRGKVWVRKCLRVKLDQAGIRRTVVRLLEEFPEVTVLLVEVNQGGDLWRAVFDDLPVKVVEVHQSVRKEVRAGWLLNGYQKRDVRHAQRMPDLDAELYAFPRGLHDDQVDAVGSGYTWLTGAGQEQRTTLQRRVA